MVGWSADCWPSYISLSSVITFADFFLLYCCLMRYLVTFVHMWCSYYTEEFFVYTYRRILIDYFLRLKDVCDLKRVFKINKIKIHYKFLFYFILRELNVNVMLCVCVCFIYFVFFSSVRAKAKSIKIPLKVIFSLG